MTEQNAHDGTNTTPDIPDFREYDNQGENGRPSGLSAGPIGDSVNDLADPEADQEFQERVDKDADE